MDPLRIAVIGCGYWGKNLVRAFWECDDTALQAACDLDPKLLDGIRRRYPTVETYRDFVDVLMNPQIDAVAIATPVSTHHRFAKQALLAGKHVLVEKPMAASTAEVQDLIDVAEQQDRVLMVDHTFLYTGAVRRMKRLIEEDQIGDLLYFDSVRVNLGLVQQDTNVLWDLAPHDFAIMDFLCDQEIASVSAIGVKHLDTPFENIAYVTVRSKSKFIGHFHLNWLAPVKLRTTLIGGTKRMIVYDDMEPTEKVKIYDKGITVTRDPESRTRLLAGYRNGDMSAPNLDGTEALRLVAKELAAAVREGRAPLSDGYSGFRVISLIEAAQRSMEQNGREVPVVAPINQRPLAVAV